MGELAVDGSAVTDGFVAGPWREVMTGRLAHAVTAAAAMTLLLPALTSAAPSTLWTRQLGTDKADEAGAVAFGPSGSIILVGSTLGQFAGAHDPTGKHDLLVARLGAGGDLVWRRQFGTDDWDRVYAVATSAAGDTYSTGHVGGELVAGQWEGYADVFLRKLGPGGGHRWTRQFGTSNDESGFGVAVDAAGDIIVVGESYADLTIAITAGPRGFVRKYAPDGTKRWTRQFGGDEDSYATGVAVVPRGRGFFVTGQQGPDGFIVRYRPNGTRVWKKLIRSSIPVGSGITQPNVHPAGVGVDCKGRPYVAGTTDGEFRAGGNKGSEDVFVRAFHADGRVRWTRQLGGAGADEAASVAVSCAGRVAVFGDVEDEQHPLPGQTPKGRQDVFLLMYSASGKRLHVSQFGTRKDDTAAGVAVGAGGRIALVGHTQGRMPGPRLGSGDDTDIFVRLLKGL